MDVPSVYLNQGAVHLCFQASASTKVTRTGGYSSLACQKPNPHESLVIWRCNRFNTLLQMLSISSIKALPPSADPKGITKSTDYLRDVHFLQRNQFLRRVSPAVFVSWDGGKTWVFAGSNTLANRICLANPPILMQWSRISISFGMAKPMPHGAVVAEDLLNPNPTCLSNDPNRNSACAYKVFGCAKCQTTRYRDMKSFKKHMSGKPDCCLKTSYGCYLCHRQYITQAEFDADHLTNGCNVKDVALGKSLPSKDSQFRQHGMQRSNFFNIPSYYTENLLETHVAAVKKLTAELKREKSKNTAAEEAIKKLTLAVKGKRVHKKPVAKQASSKKSVGSVGPSQKRGIAKKQAGKGRY
jgi:hypothetical protein